MSLASYLIINAPTSAATVASTSSASAAILFNGTLLNGALFATATRLWIKTTADCYILFGTSTVANPTSSNAMYLTAGVDYILDIASTTTHFKVLRVTTDGTVSYSTSIS